MSTEKTRSQSKVPTTNDKNIESYIKLQIWKRIRTLIILSQIFLSAPIGAQQLDVEKGLPPRLQWPGQYIHLIYSLLCAAGITVAIIFEYDFASYDLPIEQIPIFSCEYVSYVLHVLFVIYITNRSRKQFLSFYNSALKFELGFLKFGATADYGHITNFLNGHYILLSLHFIFTFIFNYYWNWIIEGDLWGLIRLTAVYWLTNSIIHIKLLQYYALLYSISKRAESLNEMLNYELAQSGVKLHGRLQHLRLFFAQLDYFHKQINESFGLFLVLVFFESHVVGTLNLFYIYIAIDAPIPDALYNVLMTFYYVEWVLMHFSKMFLILYYNHRIQAQRKKALLTLADLKVKSLELQETITRFTLQFLVDTRSNVLCGLTVLNMDFIKSILVGISTLFIFLLQYDATLKALSKSLKKTQHE